MLLEAHPSPFPGCLCGDCLQSTRMSEKRVMDSLAPTSLLHSAEEAPYPPTCSPSPPPPPVIILGQGDSDLPGEFPETTATQSSLLGVCEYSPGFGGDRGRQGGPGAGAWWAF